MPSLAALSVRRPGSAPSAVPVLRGPAPTARCRLQRLCLQDPCEHEPSAPRPCRVRSCLQRAVDRGLSTTIACTGRSLQLKFLQRTFGQARAPIERAVAGDIVAVTNARGLQIGDTLYSGERVSFPALPTFAPERFAIARNADITRDKQFRRGLTEMAAQGVVELLLRPEISMREPILAAVGDLQFEVTDFRMAREFGCQIELSPAPWTRPCRVDREHTPKLFGRWGIDVVEDTRGHSIALFHSQRLMDATAEEFPEMAFSQTPGDGAHPKAPFALSHRASP